MGEIHFAGPVGGTDSYPDRDTLGISAYEAVVKANYYPEDLKPLTPAAQKELSDLKLVLNHAIDMDDVETQEAAKAAIEELTRK